MKRRGMPALALLFAFMLLLSACSGARALPVTGGNVSTPAAAAIPNTGGKPATDATATAAPQLGNPKNRVNCSAIAKANADFGTGLAAMVSLTADANYSAFTDPSSPVYLDFARLRGDLNTLATLPDPTDKVELAFGKPSESIAYFRELVDIAESDVMAQGKPFKDTNSSGQKVFGVDSPWYKEYSSFAVAMEKACSGFTLPTDTPSP